MPYPQGRKSHFRADILGDKGKKANDTIAADVTSILQILTNTKSKYYSAGQE